MINLLPGVVEQFQYIMRDESMHFNFGVDLINGIISENPELWTEELKFKIPGKLIKAAILEAEYADALIGNGILGLSADSFKQYVHYITDRRLESINLPKAFGVTNPFPWMSAAVDLPKEKNFFETRVTEYAGGQLEW
jgi:ribonucleoside-diphosphate reductase beta chain